MTGENVGRRSRRWYRPMSIAQSIAIRPRVYLATVAGIAAFALLPKTISANLRAAISWDVSAGVYLALALRVMMTGTSETVRRTGCQAR